MTKIVGVLNWQDSADYGGPVAPYTVDPTVDTDWIFANLDSFYSDKKLRPRYLQIDNFGNAQLVIVTVGKNISYQVNQYSRRTLPLPPSASAVEIQFPSISSVLAKITATFSIPDIHWADDVNIYAIQQAVKTGGLLKIITQKAANYPLASTDLSSVILFTCSATGIAGTLPDATNATGVGNGWNAEIWNSGASSNNLSVATQAGQTIDGAAGPLTLLPRQRVALISDGTNWQSDVLNPVTGVKAGTGVGDLAYFTGVEGRQLGNITAGALGTALLGQGLGVKPIFGALSQSPIFPVAAKSATYNMVAADVGTCFVFNAAGAVSLNLVATSAIANGAAIEVKDFGAGTLTVTPNGTDTIIVGAKNLSSLVLRTGMAGFLIPNAAGQWVFFSGAARLNRQTFLSSGTYTPDPNMLFCLVRLQAPGGGSGGVAAGTIGADLAASPGGGGGGYAEVWLTAAQVGASQTVTIGAVGSAGAAGNNAGGTGGTTSLGALISSPGGAGSIGSGTGTTTRSATGGAGGVPTIGDYKATGNRGGASAMLVTAAADIFAKGGDGASGILGGGNNVSLWNSSGTVAGVAGTNYGGGAAGASSAGIQAAVAGAVGGAGYIDVLEVCAA